MPTLTVPSRKSFPLSQADIRKPLTVLKIDGPETFVRRLAEMGLHKDSRVQVTSNGNWGPLIVSIGTTRLIVDRKMAENVLVEHAEI